ncbi:hypothetical protein B296_00024862 [Ensete ventricosum]|uniref:Uncharacterized protein n=1 Tax=Ensete ventricosum TaxID=4639 RepID=A0A426ZLC7_ENSVE|nr:hypothetical protein B296_00024862 [Ensete ventricosum]
MHRVDAVGNPLGVRRELAESIGSLLGWRKGVRQKKIETRRKIIGGSRKVYRERLEDSSQECQRLPDWRDRFDVEVTDGQILKCDQRCP